jgi:hypothetical protein
VRENSGSKKEFGMPANIDKGKNGIARTTHTPFKKNEII